MVQIPNNARTQSQIRKILHEVSSQDSDIASDLDALEAIAVTATSAFGTDAVLLRSNGVDRVASATAIPVANVVTASANHDAAGRVIESAGADRSIQDTAVLTVDLVTASANHDASGRLIESAGADRSIQDTSILTADVVTAAAAFVDNNLILGAGSNKTTKVSAFNESNLSRHEKAFQDSNSSLVFLEPFVDVDGDGNLHNTDPWLEYTSSSSIWSAHTNFNKDGTMDGGGSGAFMPFTPVAGRIYWLELGLKAAVSGGVAGQGLVFGFGEGLPSTVEATGAANWMESDDTTGKATIFLTNDSGVTKNQIRFGNATDGFFVETDWINSGMADSVDANFRIRLILDTTASDGVYTAQAIAKRGQDQDWIEITNKRMPLTAQDIGAVGIATTDVNTVAEIDYFSLMSMVPDSRLFGAQLHVENVIYHELFNGFSAQNINGVPPTLAPDGEEWHAKNSYFADGRVTANTSGMYLDFAPVDGRIYFYDFLIGAVSGGASGFGFAMGYCEGKSSTPEDTGADAFMFSDPTTSKWGTFLRTTADAGSNFTALGSATSGFPVGTRVDWTDATLADDHGKKWVRLILDTTYADGVYRGQCFSRRDEDEQWVPVSDIRALTNQDIAAIGFASAGSTTTTTLFEMKLWYVEPKKNTVTEEFGAGTAYTLTASTALVDLGTTDPAITIPEPGEYLLIASAHVNYVAANFASAETLTLKLRRTNNTAADIADSVRTMLTPGTGAAETFGDWVTWVAGVYTTDNNDDAIEIQAGLSATPSSGSVQIDQADIRAIKLV